MTGRPRNRLIGVGMLLGLAMLLPALVGQGCPTNSAGVIVPVGQDISGSSGGGTASGPTLAFTYPLVDLAATVGQIITLEWTVTGSTTGAITLLLDPDRTYGNGNEIVILPLVLTTDPVNGRSFDLDTSGLRPATYRIIARITDGVNPEQIAVAAGRLLLYGAGLLPGNVSPSIVVSEPASNRGVSQGDTVTIRYCGRDIDDDGKTPPTLAQTLLILDLDNNPTNDIDLSGTTGEATLRSICQSSFFPVEIKATPTSPPSAYVLACFPDTKCTQASQSQQYVLTIDVGSIPPREDGLPYYVRGLMWDRVNRPVNAYAPGTISITASGSGQIDLAKVGHTISGTRFLGFNAGDRAGYTGTTLGDFDQDGVADFMIVSRFGRAYERGNVGSAYMIYGTQGQKFANEIPLVSVGGNYRGCSFAMGVTTGTQGITSVATIDDLDGDGKPELLFGCPYVEVFFDYFNDDPSNNPPACWNDLFPNPLHSSSGNLPTYLGNYDWRETVFDDGTICSNDLDLSRRTPINQGYVFYVRSDNTLEDTVIDLRLVGQRAPSPLIISTDEGLVIPPSAVPSGARFRGGWWFWGEWDFTQTRYPYAIIPDNSFGQTVASMPDMGNGHVLAQRDGRAELLMSAPDAFKTRGAVSLTYGQEFGSFSVQPVQSLPNAPRHSQGWPVFRTISGRAIGDRFGYASSAGDFNLDASPDILAGAPGASRDGLAGIGIVYVLFGRVDFGDIDMMARVNLPRMEIQGTRPQDHFGQSQTLAGDLNQDGIPDIAFSSPYADGPGGTDSGFIGIVFGGQRLTGENIFTVEQVGTAQLPGVKIYGTQPNGHAGSLINKAGDFNGDSIDDLLIVAPNEVRTVNGTQRRGVTYLVFGGPHLAGNKAFNLSQVGTPDLPGITFVSPYVKGTADEAPIDYAGAAGDVNGDGFDDILIGISEADYVNPFEPSQRRTDAGEMYLIYGSNTGSNSIP